MAQTYQKKKALKKGQTVALWISLFISGTIPCAL